MRTFQLAAVGAAIAIGTVAGAIEAYAMARAFGIATEPRAVNTAVLRVTYAPRVFTDAVLGTIVGACGQGAIFAGETSGAEAGAIDADPALGAVSWACAPLAAVARAAVLTQTGHVCHALPSVRTIERTADYTAVSARVANVTNACAVVATADAMALLVAAAKGARGAMETRQAVADAVDTPAALAATFCTELLRAVDSTPARIAEAHLLRAAVAVAAAVQNACT